MVSLPFSGAFASTPILSAQPLVASRRRPVRLAPAFAVSIAAFPSRLDDGGGEFKISSHGTSIALCQLALACGTIGGWTKLIRRLTRTWTQRRHKCRSVQKESCGYRVVDHPWIIRFGDTLGRSGVSHGKLPEAMCAA